MLWNIMIHVVFGIAGKEFLRWDLQGMVICVLVVAVTQALDIVRLQMYFARRQHTLFPSGPTWEELSKSRDYKLKMIQLYLIKVVFYGAVVLVSASLIRNFLA